MVIAFLWKSGWASDGLCASPGLLFRLARGVRQPVAELGGISFKSLDVMLVELQINLQDALLLIAESGAQQKCATFAT